MIGSRVMPPFGSLALHARSIDVPRGQSDVPLSWSYERIIAAFLRSGPADSMLVEVPVAEFFRQPPLTAAIPTTYSLDYQGIHLWPTPSVDTQIVVTYLAGQSAPWTPEWHETYKQALAKAQAEASGAS